MLISTFYVQIFRTNVVSAVFSRTRNLNVTRKKAAETKFVHKMLMKLTPESYILYKQNCFAKGSREKALLSIIKDYILRAIQIIRDTFKGGL